MIDLTHPIEKNMPIYPGDPKTIFNTSLTHEADGLQVSHISFNLHAGTHIDAPYHILKNGRRLSDYPLDYFGGIGIIYNLQNTKEVVAPKVPLPKNTKAILLYSGKDAIYGKEEYYINNPVITNEFIHFLIENKIRLLGMDFPSPDQKDQLVIHKRLLENDILPIENLRNLENLQECDYFNFYAIPLLIKEEASPVRAFATHFERKL